MPGSAAAGTAKLLIGHSTRKIASQRWVRFLEDRRPAFIGEGRLVPFGGNEHPWGNLPAFDILELGSNEGEDYVGSLRLSFAGECDLAKTRAAAKLTEMS